ncbi:hypothetical protein QAD02_008471 [Eretmocerus hayati]|uniref:Uncharacterized protein n=1 Tax=Eretmocerus hayati TaxID=131215 RepID=A0ACC2N6Y2_9HYME|nr:hypothetical protein QAD02_008471 [Eretmocerus hayati]
MSPAKHDEFYTWYASVSHLPFCPKTELEEYCKRDVTVLRQACIKFREIFMVATGICPFSKPITIAGACFDLYRTSFMSDRVIGVLSRRGYVHANEQSKKALQWLSWREKEDGLQRPMLHAGRGRERRIIKNLRVHGYYDREIERENDAKTRGLSVEYVNTFLKIKQEARGWPDHCVDDASEDAYIEEYFIREGNRLDKDKIKKNSGLRSTIKLLLNNLWRRFGMRGNMTKTEMITDPAKLLTLPRDPGKDVGRLQIATEDVVYASYKEIKNIAPHSAPDTNVVVAAYTTAQGRLKLYEYLEKFCDRRIYMDTDSLFLVPSSRIPDQHMPPTGNFLGDLTNDHAGYGPGTRIKTFVSGGTKF